MGSPSPGVTELRMAEPWLVVSLFSGACLARLKIVLLRLQLHLVAGGIVIVSEAGEGYDVRASDPEWGFRASSVLSAPIRRDSSLHAAFVSGCRE